MCLACSHVTSRHVVNRGRFAAALQAFSPCRPAPRAHLSAAPRAAARTPLPHHADVIVASAVRRGRIRAVPVARWGALDRFRRVGVDADHPVRHRLARGVDAPGVPVRQLGGHWRKRQGPHDAVDHIVAPDNRDGPQASVAPGAVQDILPKALSQRLGPRHVACARPPGRLARAWCNRFGRRAQQRRVSGGIARLLSLALALGLRCVGLALC